MPAIKNKYVRRTVTALFLLAAGAGAYHGAGVVISALNDRPDLTNLDYRGPMPSQAKTDQYAQVLDSTFQIRHEGGAYVYAPIYAQMEALAGTLGLSSQYATFKRDMERAWVGVRPNEGGIYVQANANTAAPHGTIMGIAPNIRNSEVFKQFQIIDTMYQQARLREGFSAFTAGSDSANAQLRQFMAGWPTSYQDFMSTRNGPAAGGTSVTYANNANTSGLVPFIPTTDPKHPTNILVAATQEFARQTGIQNAALSGQSLLQAMSTPLTTNNILDQGCRATRSVSYAFIEMRGVNDRYIGNYNQVLDALKNRPEYAGVNLREVLDTYRTEMARIGTGLGRQGLAHPCN